MTATYRADHIGSLLRPPAVLEAHAARRQQAASRLTSYVPSRTTRSCRA